MRDKPHLAEMQLILNRATYDELTSAHRVQAVTAEAIAANRPYTSEIDILERGIVDKRIFKRLQRNLRNSAKRAA
jgi:DNA uptake protein ComE-like DNA-binding protein